MRYLLMTLLCLLLSFTAQANQVNTVVYETTTIGQAEAKLPVIDGSADSFVENLANEALLKAAKEVVKAVGNNGDLTYEVTLNRPSLLSVLLKAENGNKKAYEAVNIDMASGKTFGLHDFYMDVEGVNAAFADAKDVLFDEKGIYKQTVKMGDYDQFISYKDMLPYMRIGEAGRLLKITRLTEASKGKTVVMDHCSLVAFKLEGNPSTGYTWNVANRPAYQGRLEKVGSSFIIPGYSEDKTVGQPAMEIMMVAMKEPGKYDLQLEYRRPWEKLAGKKINFNIIVKDY